MAKKKTKKKELRIGGYTLGQLEDIMQGSTQAGSTALSKIPYIGGFSRLGRYPVEIGRILGGSAGLGLERLLGADSETIKGHTEALNKPMYMSDEEWGKTFGAKDNITPLLESVSAGSEILKALPFGKLGGMATGAIASKMGTGIGSKALPWLGGKVAEGSAIGLSSGVQTMPVQKPSDILKHLGISTGVGAGLNVGLGALGEGAKATGKGLQKWASGIGTKKVPYGYSQREEAFQSAKELTGKANSDITIKGIDKTWKKLGQELDKSIRSSTVETTKNEIRNRSISKLVSETGIDEGRAASIIDAHLSRAKVGDVLDAQGIANLKKFTQATATNVEKALEAGKNPVDKMYAGYLINETADDILKPGLDDAGRAAYQSMARLREIAPDVIESTQKSSSFYMPLIGLRLPTFGIPKWAGRTIGGGLEKIGEAPDALRQIGVMGSIEGLGKAMQPSGLEEPMSSPEAGLASLGQVPTQAGLPGEGGIGQEPLGAGGTPVDYTPWIMGEQSMEQSQNVDWEGLTMELVGAVMNGQMSATEADWILSTLQQSYGGGEQDFATQLEQLAEVDKREAAKLLARGVANGEVNTTTANTLSRLYGLSAPAQSQTAALDTADLIANETEQMLSSLNLGDNELLSAAGGMFRNIYGKTVEGSEEGQYLQWIGGARTKIARALGEVGNLSEPEQIAAMKLMPTLKDTKESAANKLARFRRLIDGSRKRLRGEYVPDMTYDVLEGLDIKDVPVPSPTTPTSEYNDYFDY
jgi:hypothetical protein